VPLRTFALLKARPLPQDEGPKQNNFWRTGLLLLTSAALGGIAVAIWNRRTLAQIRQQSGSGEERPDR
jgi:hypothetical protein